jgi:hypothetical protein
VGAFVSALSGASFALSFSLSFVCGWRSLANNCHVAITGILIVGHVGHVRLTSSAFFQPTVCFLVCGFVL